MLLWKWPIAVLSISDTLDIPLVALETFYMCKTIKRNIYLNDKKLVTNMLSNRFYSPSDNTASEYLNCSGLRQVVRIREI